MAKKKYKTIKDLPEELSLQLFGKPYDRIFKQKLSFSIGQPYEDFWLSLFIFCCISTLFAGDPYGRDYLFAPAIAAIMVYAISWIRHRLDFKRKHEEWEQYCQGYLDRINEEDE